MMEKMCMRFNDFKLLTEKHYSGPLYHSTSLHSALDIIEQNQFLLSMIWDPDGDEAGISNFNIVEKGYKYFLSTSREKLNSYRTTDVNYIVTFVLDPKYYNNIGNTMIKPVSFMGYLHGHDYKKHGMKLQNLRSESEERVISKHEKIPADNIIEIHIRVVSNNNSGKKSLAYERYYNKYLKLADMLKKRNIQSYYYKDKKDYISMNKNKAGTILTLDKNKDIIIAG